ncbi:ParB/RepB/Spo0J family partition protein [Bifidobacterium sp.]|jgi:ParB family chromosome partitioning protein|uniref:ParB/RepB/Spo0J family partition protein n=1 Tax=Bifidobacterium sp. TaxID=41200 RepID=UPI0025BF7C2F|nr:ParB/RepB/Spo0J family partition protein [Bifidobacterium sp.]MCI1634809.1 ParB/RepB/Spo0J family partition protein [Bifidobacterium sp.]
MASRSRLGKGLGALFPDIPTENSLDDQDVSESELEHELQIPKSQPMEQAAFAESEKDVSRETSSKRMKSRKPATGVASQASNTAIDKTVNKKRTHDKRRSVPGIDELARPSDVFFGVSRETPAIEVAITEDDTVNKEAKPKSDSNNHLEDNDEQVTQHAGSESEDLQPVAGGYLRELNIDDIDANSQQPRTIFDEEELLELSHSITEVGVLQPIVVRQRTGDSKHPPYEIIMGERRWRASQLAGLTTIPAIVKTTADDDMLRDALLENLHRVALNPLEEAAAYQQMIDEFGLTQAQLSHSVSKSRPQIANMLRLLQLPGNVQKKVASGVLSAGHARALLGLQSAEEMDVLANRIISEGLSVRSTEEIVALKTRGTAASKVTTRSKRNNLWSDSPIMHNLENHFETAINIKGNEKHGKIEITFSSPEDMSRIVDLMLGKGDNTTSGKDDWI